MATAKNTKNANENANYTLLVAKHFIRLKCQEIFTPGFLSFIIAVLFIFSLFFIPYSIGSTAWKFVSPEVFADCDTNHYKKDDIFNKILFSHIEKTPKLCDEQTSCSCNIIIEKPNQYDAFDRWFSGIEICLIIIGIIGLLLMLCALFAWLAANYNEAKKLAYEEKYGRRSHTRRRRF